MRQGNQRRPTRGRSRTGWFFSAAAAVCSLWVLVISASRSGAEEYGGSVLVRLKPPGALAVAAGGVTGQRAEQTRLNTLKEVASRLAREYGMGTPDHFLESPRLVALSTGTLTKDEVIKGEYLRLTPEKGVNIEQLIGRLATDSRVAYVEKEGVVRTFKTPNDELFAQQYAHAVTQAPLGWDIHSGTAASTVAILDTGVDLDHPDLRDSIVPGANFVPSVTTADDDNGHGTHCAGIAAATGNNRIGVAGVSWAARIMPVKVLDSSGNGKAGAVAAGIWFAAENGANVINLSLGTEVVSQVIEDAIAFARSRNIVVVAAAGNRGDTQRSYPAASVGVLAVGATDSRDERAPWSSYGDWVSSFAPGDAVLSTTRGGGYERLSGTSMATAYVSGAVALVRSRYPALSESEVRALITQSSDDIGEENEQDATQVMQGRLNIARLMEVLPRVSARLALSEIVEVSGNQDGQWTPGEQVALRVGLRNLSAVATSYRVVGSTNSAAVEITASEKSLGTVPSGGSVYPAASESILITMRDFAKGIGDSALVTLRLVADHGEVAELSVPVPLGFAELSGFPLTIPQARSAGPITVDDIDEDGDAEAVFAVEGTFGNFLWVISHEGNAPPRWPQSVAVTSPQGPIGQHIAIGNIADTPGKEIVAMVRGQVSSLNAAPVYAFSSDGRILSGFPRSLGASVYAPVQGEYYSYGATTPTLVDVDRNGLLDIVVGEGVFGDVPGVSGRSRIFAIAGNGAVLPEFPLDIPEQISPGSPLVVDDLDGDDEPEFATITNFTTLRAWNHHASTILQHTLRPAGSLVSAPLGLVAVHHHEGHRSLSSFGELGLSLIRLGTGVVPGFPSRDGLPTAPDAWRPEGAAQVPVWGDFDRDGSPEGVYASGAWVNAQDQVALNAVDGQGKVKRGFPVLLSRSLGTMITGQLLAEDLDGDESPEFFVPLTKSIEIRSLFGNSRISGSIVYPADCEQTTLLTPTIADLNSNGVPELLFPCRSSSQTVSIHAVELTGSRMGETSVWPMYQRDPIRSGRIDDHVMLTPTPTPSPTVTPSAVATPQEVPTASPTPGTGNGGPVVTPQGGTPTPEARAARLTLKLRQLRAIRRGRAPLRLRIFPAKGVTSLSVPTSRLVVTILCTRGKVRVRRRVTVKIPGSAEQWLSGLSPRMRCQATGTYRSRVLGSAVSQLR